MSLTTVLIYILFFISVMMVILAFARPQSRQEASARLEYLKLKKADREKEIKDSLRRAKALGQQLAEESQTQLAPFASRLIPDNLRSSIQRKLEQAGLYEMTVDRYAVNQLLYMVGFPLVFLVLNSLLLRYSGQVLLYALPVLLALGYYYPIVRLNTQIEARRRAIFRAFPDTVDLLAVCLEAGMGIDAALNLVSQKGLDGPLKDELVKTLKEVRVGKPRSQALKDMARRVEMKEMTSFVVAVVQADQVGGNLARTLKVQSEINREARWQRAQEMAQKAPIKLLFPMLLLIFPNIFLIIFGPMILAFILGKL